MRQIQILREEWFLKEMRPGVWDVKDIIEMKPDDSWLPATMPAQVHDILLAHKQISDPRIGRNAAESAWVGERDWLYATEFMTPDSAGPVFLCFDGLDTLATLYLNGQEIGKFDNMYRCYEIDVSDYLQPQAVPNRLLLHFAAPLPFLETLKSELDEAEIAQISLHHYIRKCHSDFGAYLGARPHSVKVGIFDWVTLDLPDRAWFDDVWVRAQFTGDFLRAVLQVFWDIKGELAELQWQLVDPTGASVSQGSTSSLTERLEINLREPYLWWPRSHGQPHLYTLTLSLSLEGALLDKKTLMVGLREIEPVLTDPATGEDRFQFLINGQSIFLRGACWAPVEGMSHVWSHDRAMHLLDLVEYGQMNVLRIWGQAALPPQAFYAECDRRGILVWQDFMFGYGMHPEHKPEFVENCQAEITDMVRRLRNHPCIFLWCGGNENHMGWDFKFGAKPNPGQDLFQKVMPRICAELDPTRLFHLSSPYGGSAPNWPLTGDWHDYTTLTFSPEASVPLYTSETGRVSPPSLASMRRFMADADLWPEAHDPRIHQPGQAAWPPMWQYRSVNGSWDKIGPIEEFCDPTSASELIRILGTAHGEYLQRRIERQRRGVPDGHPDGKPNGGRRSWGNTVWRLNDSWPIIYWSVVDYYLQPKIAYYFLRRAYEPVLICFERTPDRISVWVVNDSPDLVQGNLSLKRNRFDGGGNDSVEHELSAEIKIEPGEARRCLEATPLGPISLRHEFLQASLQYSASGAEADSAKKTAAQIVSHLLMGERYLHLPRATLRATYQNGRLEIATDVFARQISLTYSGTSEDSGLIFEDNFFDLGPGQKRQIQVWNVDFGNGDGTEIRVKAFNSDSILTLTGSQR